MLDLALKTVAFVLVAGFTTAALGSSPAYAQRVIEFEEIVVEGRIQKPEAFYILQHANLNYEALNPKPSFLKELLETVEDDLF
ncbi:MAG: hypothetical protein H0U74_09520 [Bradymonadaceae bacterium]|nr:hypothetical protein [Lujinxingiaceae bacterium]